MGHTASRLIAWLEVPAASRWAYAAGSTCAPQLLQTSWVLMTLRYRAAECRRRAGLPARTDRGRRDARGWGRGSPAPDCAAQRRGAGDGHQTRKPPRPGAHVGAAYRCARAAAFLLVLVSERGKHEGRTGEQSAEKEHTR